MCLTILTYVPYSTYLCDSLYLLMYCRIYSTASKRSTKYFDSDKIMLNEVTYDLIILIYGCFMNESLTYYHWKLCSSVNMTNYVSTLNYFLYLVLSSEGSASPLFSAYCPHVKSMKSHVSSIALSSRVVPSLLQRALRCFHGRSVCCHAKNYR